MATSTYLFNLLSIVLLVSLPNHSYGSSQSEIKSFDAKPNGQLTTVTTTFESIHCQFSFAVVGGTNENWAMQVSREKDGKYTCEVTRPDRDSYLVFMNFKLNIKGGKISHVEAYDKDSKLNPNVYTVTDSEVRHVEGKFKANLKLLSVSINKHDEL